MTGRIDKMSKAGSTTGLLPAAVVLAAGLSRRMGRANKLLAELDGKPLLCHAADALADAGFTRLHIITGHQAEAVEDALREHMLNRQETCRPILHFIFNPEYATGLASSIAKAADALAERDENLLVCLGDMPFISAGLIHHLVEQHNLLDDPANRITLPFYKGRRGNPVLWGKRFLPQLKSLRGDCGGRQILYSCCKALNRLDWPHPAIHQDIDTIHQLNTAKSPGDDISC